MTKYPYPNSPEVNVKELLEINTSYRKHVLNTLLSMVVFILGYLLILALSIALIYFGAKLAMGILLAKVHWITLAAAAGVMLTVIMFFVFLVKFLFKVKKEETKGKIEIKREEHPLLFDFIEKVCNETKAPFPKKIVLSSDVNACVFYNSSFLSMFFPVRKNLEIGLGLVNCINITEFKAIIAHEFGHFSQSSTRLGSYVYRFNRIIYNLLYDNDGWSKTLESISSVHYILSFFANITLGMVKLVIEFFILLYKLINLSYMSLSREMEFNADNVAVSVSGSKPIISALYRAEFGQEAFNYTLQAIHNYTKEGAIQPKNFFSLMQRNINTLSKLNKLQTENGLPVINTQLAKQKFLESRINYKDIWATHPPTVEREKNAERFQITSHEIKESAWLLFNDPQKLQEKMSSIIPELGDEKKKIIDNDLIIKFIEEKETETTIHPVYNEYYSIAGETYASPQSEQKDILDKIKTHSITDLFNDELILKIKRHNKNLEDTELIKNISEGHLKVKRFEFDGKQFTRYYSSNIYQQLLKETQEEHNYFNEHKQKVADWFYAKAADIDQTLALNYKSLMAFRVKMAADRNKFVEHLNLLLEFYHKELNQQIQEDDIKPLRTKLKKLYDDLKTSIKEITEENVPVSLVSGQLIPNGYKEYINSTKIDDPLSSRNFEGFADYYNGINSLISNLAELDNKVFYKVIAIQTDILKKQGLIS